MIVIVDPVFNPYLFPGIDFITCLVTIPFTVVYELLQYRLVYDVICKTYMFLITSTVPFSAYIMVGIAVDRYLCICHPLLQVFTVSRVKLVISLLTIPAMAFGTLTALSFGTSSYESATYSINHNYPNTNGSAVTFNNSNFGVDASLHGSFSENESIIRGKNTMRFRAINLVPPSRSSTSSFSFENFSSARPPVVDSTVVKVHVGEHDTIEIHHVNSEPKLNGNSQRFLRFKTFLYHGTCTTNGLFSDQFLATYTKVHALNFMIAFIIVVVLYVLIYKSIITRRAEKEARRNKNYVYTPGRGAGVEDGHVTEETEFTQKAFGDRFSSCGKTHDSPRSDKMNDLTSHTTTITTFCPEPTVAQDQAGTVKDVDTHNSPEALHEDGSGNKTINGSQNLPEDGLVKTDEGSQLKAEERPLIRQHNPAAEIKNSNQDSENNRCPSSAPAPETRGRSSRRFPFHNPRASKEKHKRNAAGDKRDAGYKRVSVSSSLKHKDANSIKRKRPCNKHQMYMANIKTALMLLVVTTVFMVAFLPSLLMANNILPKNLTVFYGYFIYHVTNPFIYAFMNQNFRDDLKKILSAACRRG